MKLENALSAASAISELSEVEHNNSSYLALSYCVDIIINEIGNVRYKDFSGDRILQDHLDQAQSLAFLVAAMAFDHINKDQPWPEFEASCLYRCISDLHNDLRGERKHDWSNQDHWASASSAREDLAKIRSES